MDERSAGILRLAGGILAAVVAGIHLLHPVRGVPRLVRYATVGVLADPRPLAFTLAGFLLLSGIGLAYTGVWTRHVYLGGIALSLALLGGYAAWHTLLDHGAFWPYIETHGHSHGDPVGVVFAHLAHDRPALGSKLAEAGLAVVLGLLYVDRTGK